MISRKLSIIASASILLWLASTAASQAKQAQPIVRQALLSQQNSEAEFTKLLNRATELSGENDPAAWRQAISTAEEALAVLQRLEGDQRDKQAPILYVIGDAYASLDQRQTALDYYQQSLSLRKSIGDRSNEEKTLHQIGSLYEYMGNSESAIDYYQQALSISVEETDYESQTSNLNSLGAVHSAIGKVDIAISYYQQALNLATETNNLYLEAIAIQNIGSIYESVGNQEEALSRYLKALQSIEKKIDPTAEENSTRATILNNIGMSYDRLKDTPKAISYLQQALSIYKTIGDSAGIGGVLNNLGSLYDLPEEQDTALNYYLQALPTLQAAGKRSSEAATLNSIGFAYTLQGDGARGIDYYQQAALISREIGDRSQETITLYNIASGQKKLGQLEEALTTISAAVALVEDLRNDISDSELLASYFTTVQKLYQLKTDLLMQLDKPGEAFSVSEAARARLLIKLLNEANVDLRADVAPELVQQETALRQRLRFIENQRIKLSSSTSTAGIAKALEKESDTTVQQLEQTLAGIRQTSPAYAALTQPDPVSVQQVSQEILDDETVLLQYAIGEEQSYLWIIGANNQGQVHALAGRSVLEEVAKPFLSAIASDSPTSAVDRLGQALMAQVLPESLPSWVSGKRLIISADGILSEVPFGALPLPKKEIYTPLLVEHEIISEPSISALAALRQQFSSRPEPPISIAVLADPVYEASDSRVARQQSASSSADVDQPNPIDSTTAPIEQPIPALPYTRREAESILAIASSAQPPIKTTSAYDFDATYDWITDPALSEYSIVHLATHGFANPTSPQLSYVALSLVDANGNPKDNGLLQLHDIFNLNLAAELVVLSACQTGEGKDVSGEGIIGLSRGFMYAGAKRVMVSLWNVSDRGTADLMNDFYRAMIVDKLSPAAALRTAQKARWENGDLPYKWAAFTLQGEWQ